MKPLKYADGPVYVKREGPKYFFYLVVHELYDRSKQAQEFVNLVYNTGKAMDDKTSLTLPAVGEYANIRKHVLSLPWRESTHEFLNTYQHPVLILSRTELAVSDFDENAIRLFLFPDACVEPDSYFEVLRNLAAEANSGSDLFALNPHLGRLPAEASGFFRRLWDAIDLKPNFFGIGIDLKKVRS